MSPLKLSEEFSRSSDRAGRALRDYLGDPSEKNTRALRASLRRLLTVLGIIPKRDRSKTLKRVRRRCRVLMRSTSKVRDIDVIADRLSRLARDGTVELLLNNLKEEREEFTTSSIKAAWRLFESQREKPDRSDFLGSTRWMKRALAALDSKISDELPLVVKDEAHVEELHSLRQHAKTMRYMLDLVPMTKASGRAGEVLRSWQDVLGEIRDSDIVIEYLGRARQTRAVQRALEGERALRHRRYVAFARSYSREFNSTPSLVRLAGLRISTP